MSTNILWAIIIGSMSDSSARHASYQMCSERQVVPASLTPHFQTTLEYHVTTFRRSRSCLIDSSEG